MIGVKTPKTEKQSVVFFDKLNNLRKAEGLSDPTRRRRVLQWSCGFFRILPCALSNGQGGDTEISNNQTQTNFVFNKG